MMSLHGTRAVLTGGSRGIGQGIAIALARAGADVASIHLPDADQERITRFEEARAGSLEEAFRDGLLRADAARRAGGSAISLDDRKPEDNRQADALVNFLVRSKLATSTARETDAQHYIYTVSIDWEALDRVAREAKTSLPKVLGYGG